MTTKTTNKSSVNRRGFLGATAAMVASASTALANDTPTASPAAAAAAPSDREPFYGPHQAGIITPAQNNIYVAAFDIIADSRDHVVDLLKAWTVAAARLTRGEAFEITPVAGKPVTDTSYGSDDAGLDPADLLDLSPQRLTLTFGFGRTLFEKDGKDRFGLAAHRPEALVELPKFPGDQLQEERSGGDIMVQACADNPQIAFHAVRQLARIGINVVALRWVQAGFVTDYGAGRTARNLLGFKDGTGNPDTRDAAEMDNFIWAGKEAPRWMQGGSYIVVRRSRMALEHWDRMKLDVQEQTFGRHKISGAPIGSKNETDVVNLDATTTDGNPLIPENSHVRLTHQAALAGNKVLRRSYSYNDGISFTAERWPPWHQGMEYDAGLIFVCYQRDLRTGFIPVFEKLSRFDLMNQIVTNIGSGHFACPGGVAEGEYIGQHLFEG